MRLLPMQRARMGAPPGWQARRASDCVGPSGWRGPVGQALGGANVCAASLCPFDGRRLPQGVSDPSCRRRSSRLGRGAPLADNWRLQLHS
eukprot:157097-Pyramimonas_sp.AAC.2